MRMLKIKRNSTPAFQWLCWCTHFDKQIFSISWNDCRGSQEVGHDVKMHTMLRNLIEFQ